MTQQSTSKLLLFEYKYYPAFFTKKIEGTENADTDVCDGLKLACAT